MSKHPHERPKFEEALKRIQKSKLRLTRPRKTLLETVLKQKKPFSAPQLESRLEGHCDAVTIYRTLSVFVELGIIERCDFADDMTHYEVVLGHEGHHHHHFVCTKCKKVESLQFCLVDSHEAALKKAGYRNLKHRLEFSGLCPKCA